MRSFSLCRYTMLVYFIFLNLLALDYFAVRSVAVGTSMDRTVKRGPVKYGRGAVTEGWKSKRPGKKGPELLPKKPSKGLGKKNKKIIAVSFAAVVLAAIIGWYFSRKVEKKTPTEAAFLRLGEASKAMRDEYYKWELLFNKNLTPEEFLKTRETTFQKFLKLWKPVYYNNEYVTNYSLLEDPELEKEKHKKWEEMVEPYIRLCDIMSLRDWRGRFYDLRAELERAGLDDPHLTLYNPYAYEAFTVNNDVFDKFISGLKEKKSPEELIEKAEFFREHAPVMGQILIEYNAARYAVHDIVKYVHADMLEMGKLIDAAKFEKNKD